MQAQDLPYNMRSILSGMSCSVLICTWFELQWNTIKVYFLCYDCVGGDVRRSCSETLCGFHEWFIISVFASDLWNLCSARLKLTICVVIVFVGCKFLCLCMFMSNLFVHINIILCAAPFSIHCNCGGTAGGSFAMRTWDLLYSFCKVDLLRWCIHHNPIVFSIGEAKLFGHLPYHCMRNSISSLFIKIMCFGAANSCTDTNL